MWLDMAGLLCAFVTAEQDPLIGLRPQELAGRLMQDPNFLGGDESSNVVTRLIALGVKHTPQMHIACGPSQDVGTLNLSISSHTISLPIRNRWASPYARAGFHYGNLRH